MATSIIVEFLCGKENQGKTRLHFLYLFLCGNTQEDVIYNNITVTIIIIVISLYFVGKYIAFRKLSLCFVRYVLSIYLTYKKES